MALELVGLPQISQDGKSHWFTDSTGEYIVTENEGGWGAPNVELADSALLSFVYRMENPTRLLIPVGATIKYNVAALNTDIYAFQHEYYKDGYHQFHLVRLMVSLDDQFSIDSGGAVEFVVGDVWYNSNEFLVKQLTSEGIVVLDLSVYDDLETIIASSSVTKLLCEQNYYKDLSIEKNNKYNQMREARRLEDVGQVERLRVDQMDILLGVSSSAYQFSYGLKLEAHNTIESLLDDFKLN